MHTVSSFPIIFSSYPLVLYIAYAVRNHVFTDFDGYVKMFQRFIYLSHLPLLEGLSFIIKTYHKTGFRLKPDHELKLLRLVQHTIRREEN